MSDDNTLPSNDLTLFELKKGAPWTATKHDVLAVDRPVVIYFPGLGHFNDLNVSHEVMDKMHRFVSEYFHSNELKETPATVYLARRAETHTSSMEKAMLHKHHSDDRYISPTAEGFVKKFFGPLIPALDSSKDPEADVTQAQVHMSRILLVGHSLGTSYIQQIHTALGEHLHTKGYNEEQNKKVCGALAGLSLSTTIPFCDNDSKDLHTMHIMLDGDKVTNLHGINPEILTIDDTHPHLAAARTGSHLLLMPRYKGNQHFQAAKLIPLVEDANRESPQSHLNVKDSTGKPRIQWGVETCDRMDEWRHDPRSLLNVTQPINSLQYTFQTAAGADIVQDYVKACLSASHSAISESKPRITSEILNQIETEELSAEGRKKSNQRSERGQRYFSELVEFSQKYPASGLSR